MSTRVRSHAKINLGLAIGPVRADGYHALATIYQTLAVHDTVEIAARRLAASSASRITIACNDPRVPGDARNTCWRIVERALAHLDIAADVSMTIDKRLPVQGGLGAGSANSAAALIGLERELGVRLSDKERLAMAAEVGSDVPLFLFGGTVLGGGRGEQVSPLPDLPEMPCLIAVPPIGVSTPQAFRDWDTAVAAKGLTAEQASDRLKTLGRTWASVLAGAEGSCTTATGVFPEQPERSEKDRAGNLLLELVRAGIVNDFESVVFSEHPFLRGILEQLKHPKDESTALYAALSGSGSALFGLYAAGNDSQGADLRAAAEGLAAGGIPTIATRTIGRLEYWRNIAGVEL